RASRRMRTRTRSSGVAGMLRRFRGVRFRAGLVSSPRVLAALTRAPDPLGPCPLSPKEPPMRMCRRLLVVASMLAASAVGLPRTGLAAWPHDPNNGNVGLCTFKYDQANPVIVSDGAGGAIVAWQDFRNAGDYDIYVQRVNAAGVPQWTANGVAL